MREAEFRAWLLKHGYAASSVDSDIQRMHRVEAAMADYRLPYRDLDAGFEADRLAGILGAMRQSLQDLPATPPPLSLVPRSTRYEERLNSAIRCVEGYRAFREASLEPEGDADRIRRHALEAYIGPARARGDAEVIIRSRDVNEALALNGHWRNIWQALRGARLQEMANVPAPQQVGANESSATEFIFALAANAPGWAEQELRRRYGAPNSETLKMLGFTLQDGRQVGLQRDVQAVQVWLESTALPPDLPGIDAVAYEPMQPRHSNLPPRLRHTPMSGIAPRAVVMARTSDIAGLHALLDWYDAQATQLDRSALELLRDKFLALHPDFITFAQCPSFAKGEDDYKRALVARAAELVGQASNDRELGSALVDLACNKTNLFSNLIDWRAAGLVDEVRSAHPGIVEAAMGRMVRAEDGAAAVIACIDEVWPLFIEGRTSKPYAESRMVPTMVRALVHPAEMLGIRSTPTNNAHIHLLGRPAFAWDRLSRPELDSILRLAGEIRRIMQDEWNWQPRDMWDVQSFIWETCQNLKALQNTAPEAPSDPDRSKPEMPAPTNLILYGPPGTGKTYATALEAVKLCDTLSDDAAAALYPATEAGRKKLMQHYRDLQEREHRIEFVTFHQSYSYEDFVEGLRPRTSQDAQGETAAGFRLEPEAGIFRQIAERAQTPAVQTPPAVQTTPVVQTGQTVPALSQTPHNEPESARPHVLIIDEINRANISKVFGELITLIEPDKRLGEDNALTLTLPYSKRPFGVPANLHIIGTMNTADRSIALLDTALRRRFEFREIEPDPDLLGTDVDGINLRQVLITINQRIEYLVGRDHRIGHAFFLRCKDRPAIHAAMRNKVIPLLQEYFFEDWSRVHAVLGDEFIGHVELAPPPGIAGGPQPSWCVHKTFADNAYDRLGGKANPANDSGDDWLAGEDVAGEDMAGEDVAGDGAEAAA